MSLSEQTLCQQYVMMCDVVFTTDLVISDEQGAWVGARLDHLATVLGTFAHADPAAPAPDVAEPLPDQPVGGETPAEEPHSEAVSPGSGGGGFSMLVSGSGAFFAGLDGQPHHTNPEKPAEELGPERTGPTTEEFRRLLTAAGDDVAKLVPVPTNSPPTRAHQEQADAIGPAMDAFASGHLKSNPTQEDGDAETDKTPDCTCYVGESLHCAKSPHDDDCAYQMWFAHRNYPDT